MVGSKQLNKLKATPKISIRTWQAAAATPATPATEENSEDLIKTIREIATEELHDLQEKISEIIKSQLTKTNECLDKISQKVVDITKSLTQRELHDGFAGVKNDIKKVQTDLRETDDLLYPNFVMEKIMQLEDRSTVVKDSMSGRKIACFLYLLMSVCLYFLDAFNKT